MLGNVVDVEFTPETLPNINDALLRRRQRRFDTQSEQRPRRRCRVEASSWAERRWQARELTLEVQDELGNNQVRCLALGSTDGLVRGAAGDAAPAARSRFRSAKARSGASSTCSARRSIATRR